MLVEDGVNCPTVCIDDALRDSEAEPVMRACAIGHFVRAGLITACKALEELGVFQALGVFGLYRVAHRDLRVGANAGKR